jgi:hypothetical protein
MTRVFVPPFREHFGDTKGSTGATMEDGTVYRARRGGVMTVDDPGHVRAMRRDGRLAIESMHDPHPERLGTVCSAPGCRFRGFPWQTECPRCGSALVKEEPDA